MTNPTDDIVDNTLSLTTSDGSVGKKFTFMQRVRLSAKRAKSKAKRQRMQERKVKAYKHNIKRIETHQNKTNYTLSTHSSENNHDNETLLDDDWTCIVIQKTPKPQKQNIEHISLKRRNSSPIQMLFNQITEQQVDNTFNHNKNDSSKDMVIDNSPMIIMDAKDIVIDNSPMIIMDANDDEKRFRPFLDLSYPTDDIETAIKIELENYMKYVLERKKSKKYVCLIYFHEIKPKIVLDWKSMKCQFYENLIEQLLEFMDENDENIADNIGCDIIMKCYGFMRMQYNDQSKVKSMVFNMIYLNLSLFYRLKVNNQINKMLENIYMFLDFIIGTIYDSIYNVHSILKTQNNDLKRCIDRFIIECCKIIWSILHYKLEIEANTLELK